MISTIVILIKGRNKSHEDRDKEAKRVIDELREKGFTENEYTSGTTWINVRIRGGISDLDDAARRMLLEVHDIWFYVVPDYIGEVSDAIEKREYFKAFTLCASLYESFGKYILIKHFNRNKMNPELKLVRSNDLGTRNVIDMLYNNSLIEKGLSDDMITVNKIRNDLTHGYVPSIMSEELKNKIEENKQKVKSSLEALIQIHDKS